MAKRISDIELLEAILNSDSQKEASKLLGISEQTICNRMRTKSFKTLISIHRREMYDAVSNRAIANNMKALNTLVELLDSDSEMMRYNTAAKILSLGQQYIASQDILQRIEDIEDSIN